MQILSEMARKGYATAASVLERVLRTRPPVEEDVDDEFARILARAVTSRSVYEHRDFGGWSHRLCRLVGGARLRPTREPG